MSLRQTREVGSNKQLIGIKRSVQKPLMNGYANWSSLLPSWALAVTQTSLLDACSVIAAERWGPLLPW